jgi:hypothetical protein
LLHAQKPPDNPPSEIWLPPPQIPIQPFSTALNLGESSVIDDSRLFLPINNPPEPSSSTLRTQPPPPILSVPRLSYVITVNTPNADCPSPLTPVSPTTNPFLAFYVQRIGF